MILAYNEFFGLFQEMDFIGNERQRRKNGTNPRDRVPNIACRARIGEAKPGEDQGDADPGEDDDLMDEFKGHLFVMEG
jgi:hypothetical protein